LQNSKFDLFYFQQNRPAPLRTDLPVVDVQRWSGQQAFCPRSQQLQEEVAGYSGRDEWWWVVATVVKHG
jgi:hypothetical protein